MWAILSAAYPEEIFAHITLQFGQPIKNQLKICKEESGVDKQKNMSQGDRIMRAVLGVLFLLIGLSTAISTGWSTFFLILAAYALITAALAYCPGYALFGFSTDPHRATENQE